jgi:Carboxypeptidase regulatory-like domain
MKSKNFLDKIDVKTPCHESWDEMSGNETVRFCSHCEKSVHDISAMTRQKAEKLVKKSNGNLCVRYVKTPTGKLVTSPPKFTQIRRNATIAASILVTSLTFTTLAYAQGEPVKPKDNVTQTNKDKFGKDEIKQGFATVSGVIKDANDAVIQKAKITLRDTKTGKTFQTLSNDEGFYEFKNVEPSIYELSIESMGFKKSIWQNIKIENDTKFENVVVLEVGETTMGNVGISDEPLTTTETKIETNIQEKQIVELPINGRTFTTMGLFPGVSPKEKPIKPKKKDKKN